MKKQIALFAVVAAALLAAPVVTRAESTNAPAGGEEAAAHHAKNAKKKSGAPFHGKVAAVDDAGSTITVGNLTINITSETKITKDGKPATISDITVGEKVAGYYKKDEAGKLNATGIHIGDKPEGKKPKKADNQ